jgi:hypothetical protein
MIRSLASWAIAVGTVSLSLLPACGAAGPNDLFLSEGEVRGPALLVHYGDTTAVQLPSSARVDETVLLRFTIFRGGCIRQGPTELTLEGLSAQVQPSRLELIDLPPNTACPAVLVLDENVVSLQFSTPGPARVRLVGWARPDEQPFVLERELLVTP